MSFRGTFSRDGGGQLLVDVELGTDADGRQCGSMEWDKGFAPLFTDGDGTLKIKRGDTIRFVKITAHVIPDDGPTGRAEFVVVGGTLG
jgi:hypothetical protein